MDEAETLNDKAVLFGRSSKTREAESLLIKALDINPNHPQINYNLATIYKSQGKYSQAVKYFLKTIKLNPHFTLAYTNLGISLTNMEQLDKAIGILKKAVRLEPLSPQTHNNLGTTLMRAGKLSSARNSFKKAVSKDPSYFLSWGNLGLLHQQQGNLNMAQKCFEKAVKFAPSTSQSSYLRQLFFIYRQTCNWPEAEKLEKRFNSLKTEDPLLSLMNNENPAVNLEAARVRSQRIKKESLQNHQQFIHIEKRGHSKIRIGYVSSDFRDHPVGQMTTGIFKLHDRKKFEIYAYSYEENDRSIYRKFIKKYADKFIDIKNDDDSRAAKKIDRDKIDILVDLTGHTLNGRLGIFALHPAPIQVSWLGFPGTTGADFIDYIIADKTVIPTSQIKYYSEKPLYLPRCYQVNSILNTADGRKPQRYFFGLPETGFIFVNFGQSHKIEPVMFRVWMNILRRVPKSILWLWGQNKYAVFNLKSQAKNLGIDPKRLIFSTRLLKPDHISRLALADLALDTRIYGGHTTTSDMLWAGVPVLTKIGKHFASRVSASILIEAGLPELITKSPKEYEDNAVNLALNPKELKKIRSKISRKHLLKSLFNTKGFVKDLETLYQKTLKGK